MTFHSLPQLALNQCINCLQCLKSVSLSFYTSKSTVRSDGQAYYLNKFNILESGLKPQLK